VLLTVVKVVEVATAAEVAAAVVVVMGVGRSSS